MATPTEMFVSLVGSDPLIQGLVSAVVIALLNTPEAAAIMVVRDPSERTLDTLLGVVAGVMLSASFTGSSSPASTSPHSPPTRSTPAASPSAASSPCSWDSRLAPSNRP
ncbi:MAG: hypothetical protein ABEJ05_05910 [Haloglomus sp.]